MKTRTHRSGRIVAVALGAALVATGSANPPTARAGASGLQVTGAQVNKEVNGGGALRLAIGCGLTIAFTDATPPPDGTDGSYVVLIDGQESGWADLGTSAAYSWGCPQTDGKRVSIVIREEVWDEGADDYVVTDQSVPFEWTFRMIGHPTGVDTTGVSEVTAQDVPTAVAGRRIKIDFEGRWADAATVRAKVTAARGWTSLGDQDSQHATIRTTWNPDNQVLTFTPPRSLAGRSLYVTVKGSDGRRVSGRSDYLFTWEPILLVAPDADRTRSAWVSSFGARKLIDDMWLTVGDPQLTRAGRRAGVKFTYQYWWGARRGLAWTWHGLRFEEFGGCPTVTQHVRVIAYVPGRLPLAKGYRADPVCEAPTAGRVASGAGTATAPSSPVGSAQPVDPVP